MNKLQGFYELQKSGLPAVPWKKFEKNTRLDPNILWTVRSAVLEGDDMNLPRVIGVTAAEAEQFAGDLMDSLQGNDLIIYYPYFIAEKSGVLEVKERGFVLEGVAGDLWNLVTHNKLDASIVISDEEYTVRGEEHFFGQEEILDFVDYAKMLSRKYTSVVSSGQSLFLEWSFAWQSDVHKNRTGARQLVFYELRSVK